MSAAPHDPAGTKSYEQDFVITAYYSPLPNQSAYVTGSYESDVVLNGGGIQGASGIAVHPGMIAAPKSFPFGTRVLLPEIGTVTVEDRGGAIIDLENGKVRLDVWAGEGEEGLARALRFGVQRVRGRVYPVGTSQPQESLVLESFPAPLTMLADYITSGDDLIGLDAKRGEKSIGTLLLQRRLAELGYFKAEATGLFGQQTEESLGSFLHDAGLDAPSSELTRTSAAYIVAAATVTDDQFPVGGNVSKDSEPSLIRDAQRTLRYLGYYRGRTNGKYNATLRDAIIRFQQQQGIVASAEESGAGIGGPKTRSAMSLLWKRRAIERRAQHLLVLARIRDTMREKGYALSACLKKGDTGAQVQLLQRLLAERGYLGADRQTGTFGAETHAAVVRYQLATKLIRSSKDAAAGYVGPGTRQALQRDVSQKLYELVRSEGWQAL